MIRYTNMNNNRKVNNVKIDGLELKFLGLNLDVDYVLNIPPLAEEIEEIFIPGRDGSYTRHIRWLDRELSIEFNTEIKQDYQGFMVKIYKFLEESKGKLLTINEEKIGFKIKRTSIDSTTRTNVENTVSIVFTMLPFMYDLEGNSYKI